MILKLCQCFISHVTTSETEIKLFSVAEIISSDTEHVRKYPWAAISFWNNFRHVPMPGNKIISVDVDQGWNNFIEHFTTALCDQWTQLRNGKDSKEMITNKFYIILHTNCCHKHWTLTLIDFIWHRFTLYYCSLISIQLLLLHKTNHYLLFIKHNCYVHWSVPT